MAENQSDHYKTIIMEVRKDAEFLSFLWCI